jgi:hypothetical protein
MYFVLLSACFSGLVAARTEVHLNGRSYTAQNVVIRDFAVIGGGSTGTYSAIRLRDLNNSIVVIEKKAQLGGHTYTYIDPATGTGVEAGVQVFHNTSLTTNYFGRFNISLGPAVFTAPGVVKENIDLQTGLPANYTAQSPVAAFAAYVAQLAKYPMIENGLNPTYPVPEDLLLPFGDFVEKYSLGAMVQTASSINEGLGGFLSQTALYVLVAFNRELVQNLEAGFITTANHDNSKLYEKALEFLGPTNALLSSEVVATDRTGSFAKILVRGPNGLTLIQAKKIVNTIPPKLNNLFGWDLDLTEGSLFEQFGSTAYYTALLTNTGIPSNISIGNTGNSASNYHLPQLPAAYSIQQTSVPGLIAVTYGSQTAMSENQVKSSIIKEIEQFMTASNYPMPAGGMTFVNFQNHTPFRLTVPAEAIKNGFYEQLYGLQGHLKTYYTGAAFYTHDSSMLWQFTEDLLPTFTS